MPLEYMEGGRGMLHPPRQIVKLIGLWIRMGFLFIIIFSTMAFSQSFFGDGFSAKYEESSTSSYTGKKTVTVGNIDYKYPSNLRMEINSPHSNIVVINKAQSWYYQASTIPTEKGIVTIDKSVKFPALKVFDSLYSGLANTKTYNYLNDGKQISLVFNAKSKKELNIEKIVLKSSKGTKDIKKLSQVEELIIFKSNSDFKTMRFLDFKEDVSFDKNHFIFNIPANTKTQKR